MERAALETVRVLKDRGVDFSDTLVVCGSGNNGGDGFAAARILKEYGFCAEVLFVGQDASMSEECRTQKQIAERLGISVFTDFPKKEYTVIIDAVFGVGLSRAIEGRYHTVIEWMNDKKCEKAAIDIPSGICAESGRVLGIAFRADITVSMECVKLGCELFPGKLYAGETVSVPIGIDLSFFEKNKDVCITYDPEDTFANNNVICARYLEKNIASNELTCFNVVLPEYINASDYYRSPLTFRYVNENSSAYGIVLSTPLDYDYLWTANSYGTAIPGGWLLALPYLRDNAHVRLIIPSKMGHSISQQNVIPYYYDIWKFEKAKS